MRTTRSFDPDLVIAAREGNRAAREELLRHGLPLIYTIVRRAMGDHPEVDDVAQETALRALRQLPALRSPEHFRAWLSSIAMRQAATALRRSGRMAARRTTLEEVADVADPATPSQEATAADADLSRQRRRTEQAARWLDADNRALLPLWWLETAGELSRAEVANALNATPAHAGVRLQRMRSQLEMSRRVVEALAARPRCSGLAGALQSWDGTPSPLWRKRIARHLRSCLYCSHSSNGLLPLPWLLPAPVLLTTPTELAETVRQAAAAGVPPNAPSIALLATGALTMVAAAAALGTHPAQDPSATRAALTPGDGFASVSFGARSLEARTADGDFIATADGLGVLRHLTKADDPAKRAAATFDVVPGLDNATCLSFRSPDGRYLRHSSWRIRLDPDNGTVLFHGDATFCPREGTDPGSVTLESSNYPGWYLRARLGELWVDRSDGSEQFWNESSFLPGPALTG